MGLQNHTVDGNRRADWLVGGGAALLTFAVYLTTLYPGLGGGGDAAKFRFLGHVLGTAHPSGYPLYTLVSWLFSMLPVGTLAYRINLMSAVCASVAVGLTYASVRNLSGGRASAASAALALGFGRLFWSKAVLAEVYTLSACLAAATILALLRWKATGRTLWLLGAVAFASLAFGNHLTVVFAVPAFVFYAVATNRRTCLRPHVLALCAAIIALGLAQYGFIVLRTYQHAPFLESQAINLRELWEVVTARRYATDIWTFSWHQLWAERLPAISTLIRTELGAIGTPLMAVGLAWLAWTRWREAVLLVLGALAITLVTITVEADSEGFLVPSFVFIWPIVGAGVNAIIEASSRLSIRRLAVPVVLLMSAAMPAMSVAANFAYNDHSRRMYEDVYLDSLFDVLPDKTLIPVEEYAVDQLVNYELLGAGAARGRDIRLVALEPAAIMQQIDRGYGVYAFAHARSVLEGYGLAFAPVQLTGLSLARHVELVRNGHIVIVAASPGVVVRLPFDALDAFRFLGASVSSAPGQKSALVIVGVRGAPAESAPVEASPESDVIIEPGQLIANTGVRSALGVRATAAIDGVAVKAGGREVVRAASGLVVAVLTPGGAVVSAEKVDEAHGFRVPIDMRPLPIFKMTFAGRCESVGNTAWRDVTAELASGRLVARIDNYRPFDSTFVIWLSSDSVLSPRQTAAAGSGVPSIDVNSYDAADRIQADARATRMTSDGIAHEEWKPRERYTYRIGIAVNDRGDYATVALDLGGHAVSGLARARVDLNNPKRATLCSVPPPG